MAMRIKLRTRRASKDVLGPGGRAVVERSMRRMRPVDHAEPATTPTAVQKPALKPEVRRRVRSVDDAASAALCMRQDALCLPQDLEEAKLRAARTPGGSPEGQDPETASAPGASIGAFFRANSSSTPGAWGSNASGKSPGFWHRDVPGALAKEPMGEYEGDVTRSAVSPVSAAPTSLPMHGTEDGDPLHAATPRMRDLARTSRSQATLRTALSQDLSESVQAPFAAIAPSAQSLEERGAEEVSSQTTDRTHSSSTTPRALTARVKQLEAVLKETAADLAHERARRRRAEARVRDLVQKILSLEAATEAQELQAARAGAELALARRLREVRREAKRQDRVTLLRSARRIQRFFRAVRDRANRRRRMAAAVLRQWLRRALRRKRRQARTLLRPNPARPAPTPGSRPLAHRPEGQRKSLRGGKGIQRLTSIDIDSLETPPQRRLSAPGTFSMSASTLSPTAPSEAKSRRGSSSRIQLRTVRRPRRKPHADVIWAFDRLKKATAVLQCCRLCLEAKRHLAMRCLAEEATTRVRFLTPTVLAPQTPVACRYQAQPSFYDGVVTRFTPDGYHIRYADGEVEVGVDRLRLKLPGQKQRKRLQVGEFVDARNRTRRRIDRAFIFKVHPEDENGEASFDVFFYAAQPEPILETRVRRGYIFAGHSWPLHEGSVVHQEAAATIQRFFCAHRRRGQTGETPRPEVLQVVHAAFERSSSFRRRIVKLQASARGWAARQAAARMRIGGPAPDGDACIGCEVYVRVPQGAMRDEFHEFRYGVVQDWGELDDREVVVVAFHDNGEEVIFEPQDVVFCEPWTL